MIVSLRWPLSGIMLKTSLGCCVQPIFNTYLPITLALSCGLGDFCSELPTHTGSYGSQSSLVPDVVVAGDHA